MSTSAPLTGPDWRELENLLGAEALRRMERAIFPANAEQTAALARWAGSHGIMLRPGGETRRDAETSGLRVDFSRLQATRFYEPNDLTAGFEAGMAITDLEKILGAQSQFLPFDIPRNGKRKLGSAMGEHASGPLRQAYGTMRDFTIGIEFISGRGEIVHAGGRVVKNVAGYDLMKLLIGSRGSLGLITGVNFRVFPRPRATATHLIEVPRLEDAERLRQAIQASWLRPLAFELYTAETSSPSSWLAAIRFTGGEATLVRCRQDLQAIAAKLGLVVRDVLKEDEPEFWNIYAKRAPFESGCWLHLSAPPALGAAALAICQEVLQAGTGARPGAMLEFQGRLSLGVYRLHRGTPPDSATLACCRQRLRQIGYSGWGDTGADIHLSWPEASTPADRWGEWTQDRELMRQIKMELDPLRIFPDPFGLLSA